LLLVVAVATITQVAVAQAVIARMLLVQQVVVVRAQNPSCICRKVQRSP
jgi:hypothetical protein